VRQGVVKVRRQTRPVGARVPSFTPGDAGYLPRQRVVCKGLMRGYYCLGDGLRIG